MNRIIIKETFYKYVHAKGVNVNVNKKEETAAQSNRLLDEQKLKEMKFYSQVQLLDDLMARGSIAGSKELLKEQFDWVKLTKFMKIMFFL